MKEVLESTESVCPECFKEGKINKIPAEAVEEDGKVYLKKECDEHGKFKSTYWDDVELYKKAMENKVTGVGVTNPQVEGTDCPYDCGLCARHKSQSVLTNLFVTNRCDLRCSYCFANAGAQGFVYEPSLEQLEKQMKQVREEKPVPGKAIQITGGEPTVREDLVELVKMAKDLGFTHVQVNTNGIKLGDDPDLAKELQEAGTNTIYMSFDGVTEETNPWIEQNKKALENLRKVGLTAVLVPVVINNFNDHELGDIVNFAKENMDIVRGVNFQPVSFVGRIKNLSEEKRKRERISYSEMIKKLENQLDGAITAEDWYTVPFVLPVSKLIENIEREKQVEFTCHPSCGGATYVFVEDGEIIPITEFVDVEGLMELVKEEAEKSGPMKKIRTGFNLIRKISDYIDEEKAPEGMNVKDLINNAVTGGSYDELGKFHMKSLYLGSMWFQDVWNLNIDRLERCVIHYTTPDGIIPFCAYNGLGYGEEIRKKHGISVEKWEEKTGKSLKEDLWNGGKIS
ncbi:MAG: tetraether lipid synthase Tes [Candidatus Hadarchaeia archaeon]